MSSVVKKQDLPPVGGYPSINFKRVPAKQIFNPWLAILGTIAIWGVSRELYHKGYVEVMMEEVEQRSVLIALEPMLLAERDRAFLKQLRKNRDEENELMKNVPNWKTGHYYNQPLYITVPKDTLLNVPLYEYYAHAEKSHSFWRVFEFIKH
ncbi:unnamed protein product [Bemisia tabaci]|uniref:NADH dehydrogenase [ubiquinone] 1 alpha subcomplex subunit 13 n=1 Tax=Bemisia tabaci TaxID=7038 RepID=A0A9P0ABS4_BEMTA|nr:unnamed protein product [Bemisia tabaci]